MARSVVIVGLMLLFGGCGSSSTSHTIAASEFGRSCSVDADCVPVFEGTIGCCGGGCANSAINEASLAAYEAAAASRHPVCTPPPPCPLLTDAECQAAAACVAGTCQFRSTADAAPPSD